jgi:hypothetical protein
MRWLLMMACLAGGADDAGDDGAACSLERCGDPEAPTILYPGDPGCDGGCERHLAGDDIYIPPRSGRPAGDTYWLSSRFSGS